MDLLGLNSLIGGRVNKEISNKRWNHCKECTFLSKIKRCRKCGCFMNIKVKYKQASCPIGIWSKEE